MTIDEIFAAIIEHMEEGIIYHNEMTKAYDFLGLWGFSKCQEYHCFEEKHSYRRFQHYYATHYFKLLTIKEIPKPKIIPDTWYKYQTYDVDGSTKKTAVRDLIKKWIEWEKSTKKLYQEMRLELDKLGELDAARKVNDLIYDVSTELHDVEKLYIKLETINYDLITLEEISEHLHKKYKKKLGW